MGFLDRLAKSSPTLFELRSSYLYFTWRTKRRLATQYQLSMTGKFSHLHEHVMSSQVGCCPEAILKAMDSFGREDWMMTLGDAKGQYLQETVQKHRPKTVVEFGTYCGYSTLCIAAVLPPGGHLISVDCDPRFLHVAQEILAKAGLQERVTFVRCHAENFRLPPVWSPVDLLFLDHTKTEYYSTLLKMEPYFREGTVVLADDSGQYAAQLQDFLGHTRGSGLYESMEHRTLFSNRDDLHDSLEYSVYLGERNRGKDG
uniref:catechol O-methyltransferase n=1 Tax=Eutreptiella gymnastica TaxID=73025 RepID=A0A7S1J444_9EUGL|mmetsp:Transcript_65615/g.116809  ORF Transcript_65615/g.116809 Transcript_65615/m.116809 type:complete len:257 (+) Transcript_65615:140-910(+)